MKATTIFSIAMAAQAATAAPMADNTMAVDGEFKRLDLAEPLNWISGETLLPGRVMRGFHGDEHQYDAESWAQYILENCINTPGCKSTISFSAINSGSVGGRYWFGYTFSKAATPDDYKRSTEKQYGVQASIAYSL
ncbi:hypothetical protein CDD81_2010 [Ophiocordyceps australis]|uniref:Uncharacterized protein n=1 Tax=Ophiocordyceps australis TaxID=1399860 RepID=A0A2C5Y7W2_9HYPO|nr:hypothetical protein CDD81_2010 [Ophiocordyceps australis]